MTNTRTNQTHDPDEATLNDFNHVSRWVAWREEERTRQDGSKFKTKIPYDPNSLRHARIPTDPSTYGSRDQAERRWNRLDDGRPGGVGIVLGELDSETALMGIDLDTCIDLERNE